MDGIGKTVGENGVVVVDCQCDCWKMFEQVDRRIKSTRVCTERKYVKLLLSKGWRIRLERVRKGTHI